MTPNEKLSLLNDRRESVRRELGGLSELARESNNTAIPDLEAALLAELKNIERQIQRIKDYVDQIETGDDEIDV